MPSAGPIRHDRREPTDVNAMRRFLPVPSLFLAVALALAACGSDSNTTPIDEAGPGNVTDAGAEGAFGEADDCSELVDEAMAAYERVVEELGDADRSEVDRIDAAMESFGGSGPDLQVRYDALDCGQGDFDEEVCGAAQGLEPAGPVAEDFVAGVLETCVPA